MARTVDRIYDATSTSGGALDSGRLSTSPYNEGLIVVAIAVGAAAPTTYTMSLYDSDDASTSTVVIKTFTPPGIGATTTESVCVAGTVNMPCPDFVRFQAQGGASSTVRILVHGVRSGIGS